MYHIYDEGGRYIESVATYEEAMPKANRQPDEKPRSLFGKIIDFLFEGI